MSNSTSAATLTVFYVAGFVLAGGGFVLYTSTVEPEIVRETGAGSLISQVMLSAVYTLSVLLFIARDGFQDVLRRAWPILLLPALAMLSALWSPDPMLTLRRAFAFAGTIAFGLSLGTAFRFRATLGVITLSLALVMVLSIALTLIDPTKAVHQSNDAIQAVHAGYWRGIFAHRNTLGFWSAATIIMILLTDEETFGRSLPGLFMTLCTVLAAGTCLIASGSSAGLAIVSLSAIFVFVLTATLRQPRRLQVMMILFWACIGMLMILTFGELARFGLQLLGRDSDLSGRTEIWTYILDLLRASDKPLGLGYFVGTLLLDQRLTAAMQVRSVNAHNGFLEAFVYFGWTGLIIAIAVSLWLLCETLRLAGRMARYRRYTGFAPAVIVFMALAHNMVESTIVSPNNLNNVLLSVVAAVIARGRGVEEAATTWSTSRMPS